MTAHQLDHDPQRSVSVSVAPTFEPVSRAELISYQRLTGNDGTDELDQLIKSARLKIERDTRRAICAQTILYKRRGFPLTRDFFELPRTPASSITSITYIDDTTGLATTWGSSNYTLDAAGEPSRIHLAYDQDWPSNVRPIDNSVVVTYVAGAASAAAADPLCKMAVLWLAGWFFSQRIPHEVGRTVNALPDHLDDLIRSLRVEVASP
jgi:uncharacterized phiE125 gp8 family phage protein